MRPRGQGSEIIHGGFADYREKLIPNISISIGWALRFVCDPHVMHRRRPSLRGRQRLVLKLVRLSGDRKVGGAESILFVLAQGLKGPGPGFCMIRA